MLSLNLPINSVSFGQVSTALLREIRQGNNGEEPLIYPIGGSADLSSQPEDQEFANWINRACQNFAKKHDAKKPILKLWHLNGSLERLSEKQVLLTFYELDSPTETEINIARNQTKLLVTSHYTKNILNKAGLDNVEVVPLGFDAANFRRLEKNYFSDGRIVFNLTGKLEKRKGHKNVIKAWIKRFGGDRRYSLQCAVYNPFLVRQQPNGQVVDFNPHAINDILEGKQPPFNVDFLPHFGKNSLYNDYLNSANIVIGMGTEGWGLPEFHSVAIGKHAVILDCAAHQEWACPENSVLVKPSGMIPVYDNVFFKEGQDFNQGNIFTFDEESFIHGCEQAIKRVESDKKNAAGLELQEKFSMKNSLIKILSHVQELA